MKLIEPRVFGDERGFFYESYNARAFAEAIGHNVTFVQDNHSRSGSNVLRYELADGTTILVRPSGTEPKIKVYILTIGDGMVTQIPALLGAMR